MWVCVRERKEAKVENAVLKGRECQQKKVESWYYSGVGISYLLIVSISLIHRNFHGGRLCNYSKHLSNCRKKCFFFSECIKWTSACALHPFPNKTPKWLQCGYWVFLQLCFCFIHLTLMPIQKGTQVIPRGSVWGQEGQVWAQTDVLLGCFCIHPGDVSLAFSKSPGIEAVMEGHGSWGSLQPASVQSPSCPEAGA